MESPTTLSVKHCRTALASTFDGFTSNFEALLNRLDADHYADEVLTNPLRVENHLKSLEGETGLMIFNIQNHGALLNMAGKTRKAKQYVIGNPLVAIRMTAHDIRAALYAPLRIAVYEDVGGAAIVEYDLPSSLFGQFGNDEVLAVAEGLDEKLLHAIILADR